ncbi:MAG: hypothetical protein ACRCWQ_00360 [Bacilli bacterium]
MDVIFWKIFFLYLFVFLVVTTIWRTVAYQNFIRIRPVLRFLYYVIIICSLLGTAIIINFVPSNEPKELLTLLMFLILFDAFIISNFHIIKAFGFDFSALEQNTSHLEHLLNHNKTIQTELLNNLSGFELSSTPLINYNNSDQYINDLNAFLTSLLSNYGVIEIVNMAKDYDQILQHNILWRTAYCVTDLKNVYDGQAIVDEKSILFQIELQEKVLIFFRTYNDYVYSYQTYITVYATIFNTYYRKEA